MLPDSSVTLPVDDGALAHSVGGRRCSSSMCDGPRERRLRIVAH